MEEYLKRIRHLVAKDNLKEAIQMLQELLNSDEKLDELILQNARLNDLEKTVRLGLINQDDASITKNNIRFGILGIVRALEQELSSPDSLFKQRNLEGLLNRFQSKENRRQIHHGSGDNVAGNKVFNFFLHSKNIQRNVPPQTSDELLSILFERSPRYPTINFSITNTSQYPIQITKINCVKASSIKNKDKGDLLERLTGPRIKLDVDIEKVGVGRGKEIFGGSTISNLAPYESEAFQINFNLKNTSNLIDIEVEYISPLKKSTSIYAYDKLIFVGTAFDDDRNLGSNLTLISRETAKKALFDNSNLKDHLITPISLYARGAAYIFRFESTRNILALFEKYEKGWDLGPILASFSEYSISNELPNSILSYIKEWLRSPHRMNNIIDWDTETFASIIFANITKKYSAKKKIIYSLQILDEIVEFDPKIFDGKEEDDEIFDSTLRLLSTMSRKLLLDYILAFLIENLKEDFIPIVICCLNINEAPKLLNKFLVKLTGVKNDLDYPQNQTVLIFWNEWYLSRGKFESKHFSYCPRLRTVHKILFESISDLDLSRFMQERDDIIRFAVARSGKLTPNIWDKLAQDTNEIIKLNLARNKNTPKSTLRILCYDKNSIVRRWVACHENSNDEIINILISDERSEVRSFLVRNPNIKLENLESMLNVEEDEKVKREIEKKKAFLYKDHED